MNVFPILLDEEMSRPEPDPEEVRSFDTICVLVRFARFPGMALVEPMFDSILL
ncbi:MAG: hypothetical protein OXE84_12235 [Rhodobacteraceae bacterium]|nr:hypothetical protein [Paracoccaceae bacterium]MCY4198031.1 hypothetical protein [Paracoccaceae bacterium]MCY4328089.1 hypothetical protein [Paracoccaceae bacterium]